MRTFDGAALHGFNALLYALNGFLWASLAHNPTLAGLSILIAIGSAWIYRRENAQ